MSREVYGLLIGMVVILVSVSPLFLFGPAIALLSFLISREVGSVLNVETASFFSPVVLLLGVFFPELSLVTIALLSLIMGYRSWRLEDFFKTFFLLSYPALFLSYLFNLKLESTALVIILLFSIWINDVFAYYVGRKFGRTPFFPKLSPKKTVEGFVGGIIPGSVFMGLLLPVPFVEGFFIGFITLLSGVAGDYFKSFIKRQVGIKDFSSVLGEHGGFTDRFDALVFASPVFYFLTERCLGVSSLP